VVITPVFGSALPGPNCVSVLRLVSIPNSLVAVEPPMLLVYATASTLGSTAALGSPAP